MLDVVALITARGGSKGIPGKNIRPIGGKPLIAWTVEAACAARSVRRTIVSTDCADIARVAKAYGAELPFLRPAELAQDGSSHISVVLHALDYLETADRLPDYLLLLQPTSPLRTADDITSAIELAERERPDAVVSVCPAHSHPYLVKQIDGGNLKDFLTIDKSAYLRRQHLPPAYALNGALYLTRPSVLREQRTFLPETTLPYIMPAERSLELDDPWDLYLMTLVIEDQACQALKFKSPTVESAPAIPVSSLRRPA